MPPRAHASDSPGIYVHVPFCSSVCPYCDFAVRKDMPAAHAGFIEAIRTEVRTRRSEIAEAADTVYFGGGTPSVLSPENVKAIVRELKDQGVAAEAARVFFEANPEHADPVTLANLRDAGVSFLSLGVQSFDDARLAFLGRRHDGRAAKDTVRRAVGLGFDVVSIDLIYGLPEQSESEWKSAFAEALDLGVRHVSSYLLTIHEKTPFGLSAKRGRLLRTPEDREAALFTLTHETAIAAGWDAYEASNFAKTPMSRSAHNLKYWRRAPYLGIGPSAHSFDGKRRRWNVPRFERWLDAVQAEGHGVEGEEILTAGDVVLEAFMLGLRTRDGVSIAAVEGALPGTTAANRRVLEAFQTRGLVALSPDRIRPTTRGMAVADLLAAEIVLPD